VAISTITPTGRGERLLIEDAAEPAWSPDGSRIVFTSIRDRYGETCFHECSPSGEIYVARADGTDLRRLTRSQADDRSPSWAPDGRSIAFVSDRSNRANHDNEIYVIGVEGGEARRLTTNAVWDLEPDWRRKDSARS
jgi:Tol biopolymer transport system component